MRGRGSCRGASWRGAVCARLDWRDAKGRLKEMACRKRLLEMHRRGLIALPAARGVRPVARALPRLEPVRVEASLAELGKVELVCVTGGRAEGGRIWNALMQAHHSLGSGPLCGAQLRYLIRSERHGWLGGLGFSAAARRLAARDAYLGWSEAERRVQLFRVVSNSRFLILPTVKVQHLASHVLGLAARRLARDWEAHYGYRPWMLETFVEETKAGTCYRAANWMEVGFTQGRGRQDAARERSQGIKRVLLYGLEPQRFPRLQKRQSALERPRDWASHEFGRIALDARLRRRTLEVARDFFAQPCASIPKACGNLARTKAASRLFSHPKVTLDTLLSPHYEATCERIRQQSVVLAVCDSSALNYSAHPATSGLGPIGSRQDGPIGLWLHETLAFTPKGVPLGLIDVQCWARDPERFGQKHARKQRPIEVKESRKWLDSFAKVVKVQAACPNTQRVMVADRESDLYELFAKARHPKAQLLIRAEHSRRLAAQETTLWPHLQQQPIAAEIDLKVGRRDKAPSRTARLTVRHAAAQLKPPPDRQALGQVAVWAVLAREESPPPGVEPLAWMLITTVPVHIPQTACQILGWYAKRWGIEIYHRTLKSGCRIETRQLGSADRLEACLAIDLVVAWRIMHLVHLGRELPQALCTVYFDEMQWQALMVFTTRKPTPPSTPPTLREAIRRLAQLGGFLGRKGDGEPGAQSLWLGLQRLDDIASTYALLTQPQPPPVS